MRLSRVVPARVAAVRSLQDDFLKQHRVDTTRRDCRIHPTRQFFPKTVKTGGAVEVGRTQLTKVRLEGIHDAWHYSLDLRRQCRIGQFEHDLDFEILRAIASRIREI